MLDFKCPSCGNTGQLPDRVVGRKFRCPACKTKIKHHTEEGKFLIAEEVLQPEDVLDELFPPPLPPAVSPEPSHAPKSSVPSSVPSGEIKVSLDKMSGAVVGHYLLLGLVGAGSGGYVYLAEHQALKRRMAVKLLSPSLANSPERIASLAQEAVALAKVDHPNVVHVYDFGSENNQPYIAMQFVDGSSLDQAIKATGSMSPGKLTDLAKDMLEGLGAIHQAGLLHRDIKPGNVLLTKEGRALLADFGLARETPQVADLPANVFSGTAEYAAPELAVGRPPDVRTDLYALGGTLYKAATGRVPFTGSTVAEKLKKQLYEALVPPRSINPQIPQPIEDLILKLLTKEREARLPSTQEAIKLLCLTPKGQGEMERRTRRLRLIKTRQNGPALAPILIVGLALFGGLLAVGAMAFRTKATVQDPEIKRKPEVARQPNADPVPPSPPSPKEESDPTEKEDFDQLERILATAPTRPGAEACEEFLVKHPKSVYAEQVLLKKMELQKALDFERKRKEVDRDKPAPEPKIPPPPQPIPRALVEGEGAKDGKHERFHKPSSRGVPGRPLPPSIREALLWLSRHQDRDGSWRVTRYSDHCPSDAKCDIGEIGSPDYQTGVTCLSLLAILGAGIGYQAQDEYEGRNLGDTLRAGVAFVTWSLQPDGRIGPLAPKQTYAQALGIQVVSEVLRSVPKENPLPEAEAKALRGVLDVAVQFLIDAQNPGMGWRYGKRPGDNDTSVSAAALLALEAARKAGARVPDHVIRSGLNWFEQATDPQDGRVGYNARGTGKVFVPGKNENYSDHRTMSAAAWLCRIQLGKESPAIVKSAARSILSDLPKAAGDDLDFFYWYYGTRFSKVAFDDRDADLWKSALLKALSATQSLDTQACRRGSWGPSDRWACEAGRVYCTAINALTLEHAILARPFDYSPPAKVDGGSGNAAYQWVFTLKSGGKVIAFSFEEQEGAYTVKVPQGTVRLSKGDVATVTRYSPSEESVDLIKLIDTQNDVVSGEWTNDGQKLTCSRKSDGARVQIPYLPPDEYDLTVIAERREGLEALNLGLATAQAQFAVVLDGDPSTGFSSGIGLLDGRMYNENSTLRKGPVFINGRASTITCAVRKSGVTVTVDGHKIIDWKGALSRLTNYSAIQVPNPRALFLVNWNCRFEIKKAVLKPISGQGEKLR